MDRLADETNSFLHRVASNASVQPAPKPKVVDKAVATPARANHNPETNLDKKTILIVDDDMRNTFALSRVLKQKGMDVLMAGNGKHAIETLEEHNEIDAVLMDIMMPVMDGYEAMETIRKNPDYQKLPIIALTAKAMQGDKDKCLQSGASDFITKPLDPEQLLTMLRAWL